MKTAQESQPDITTSTNRSRPGSEQSEPRKLPRRPDIPLYVPRARRALNSTAGRQSVETTVPSLGKTPIKRRTKDVSKHSAVDTQNNSSADKNTSNNVLSHTSKPADKNLVDNSFCKTFVDLPLVSNRELSVNSKSENKGESPEVKTSGLVDHSLELPSQDSQKPPDYSPPMNLETKDGTSAPGNLDDVSLKLCTVSEKMVTEDVSVEGVIQNDRPCEEMVGMPGDREVDRTSDLISNIECPSGDDYHSDSGPDIGVHNEMKNRTNEHQCRFKELLDLNVTKTDDIQVKPVTQQSSSCLSFGNNEGDSWDSLFDENGDCLQPAALEGLKSALGKVEIQKPKIDYLEFQPQEPDLSDECYDHILELYDFPVEYKTQNLMMAFSVFKDRGFDIKWVDDTHALAIFSSPVAAAEARELQIPFIKIRPVSQATSKSKFLVHKKLDFLLPSKPRPETSASLARRMIHGALGMRSRVTKEQRDTERRQLQAAKEIKRQVAKQKQDIWNGTVS